MNYVFFYLIIIIIYYFFFFYNIKYNQNVFHMNVSLLRSDFEVRRQIFIYNNYNQYSQGLAWRIKL